MHIYETVYLRKDKKYFAKKSFTELSPEVNLKNWSSTENSFFKLVRFRALANIIHNNVTV
jgi:hypothetical protein